MVKPSKDKKRGFVMTGGGAKGLYEAGVINAFHLTGMEFDVISGSSIGAMNSIFFAEYLLRKKSLPAEVLADPEEAIRRMENLMRCYHRTWLLMPSERVIDDSDAGSMGKLVNDLGRFRLRLSDLVRLGWWNTDPQKPKTPPVRLWPALARIAGQLVRRLGGGSLLRGASELRRTWGDFRSARPKWLRDVLRTYFQGFGLEYSLIPAARDGRPGEDTKIEAMFTRLVAPLTAEHLDSSITAQVGGAGNEDRLVDPTRTLKDFHEKGIDVRLTRANYRTGRLEVSAYLSQKDFLRYLEKQAWRLEVSDPEKMPLGSFRLLLPGNPSAVKAALASGRFPGVFAPFLFQDIYPQSLAENAFLYQLLDKTNWMADPEVQSELKEAYFAVKGSQAREEPWQRLLAGWQKSASMRAYFPYPSDTYVDGGAIDNTPSNTIVDATREQLDAEGRSKRDTILELFVIFLETEPRISQDDAKDPLLYEVVQRTLAIQSAAAKSSDAVVVSTINKFGERADQLARSLLAVLKGLENVRDQISPEQIKELETTVRNFAKEQEIVGYRGDSSNGVLQRMEAWASDMLADKLPLHVDEIKIYPEKMSLSTLQFTERLGYRQQNAIDMITMGCYDTLWALRNHLENMDSDDYDDQDKQSLELARKWMGIEHWPRPRDKEFDSSDAFETTFETLRKGWQCTRRECVFHARHCLHGAQMGIHEAAMA